jgi:hypothetical protein
LKREKQQRSTKHKQTKKRKIKKKHASETSDIRKKKHFTQVNKKKREETHDNERAHLFALSLSLSAREKGFEQKLLFCLSDAAFFFV